MTDLSAFPITRRWPAQHPDRLQLYSLNTPNGVKASILLEELGLPYEAHLVDITPDEAFNYAPPAGQQKLCERWREKMIAENPALAGREFGLPIVTSAITHGLMLAGDLFVDPGDVIVQRGTMHNWVNNGRETCRIAAVLIDGEP